MARCPPLGRGCQGPRGEQLGGWADPTSRPAPGVCLGSRASQPLSNSKGLPLPSQPRQLASKHQEPAQVFYPLEFPSLGTHPYPKIHSSEETWNIKPSQTSLEHLDHHPDVVCQATTAHSSVALSMCWALFSSLFMELTCFIFTQLYKVVAIIIPISQMEKLSYKVVK